MLNATQGGGSWGDTLIEAEANWEGDPESKVTWLHTELGVAKLFNADKIGSRDLRLASEVFDNACRALGRSVAQRARFAEQAERRRAQLIEINERRGLRD